MLHIQFKGIKPRTVKPFYATSQYNAKNFRCNHIIMHKALNKAELESLFYFLLDIFFYKVEMKENILLYNYRS